MGYLGPAYNVSLRVQVHVYPEENIGFKLGICTEKWIGLRLGQGATETI